MEAAKFSIYESGDDYKGLDESLQPDLEAHEGPLTLNEQSELARREQNIARGLHIWREVGASLCVIRDKRLYRGKYDSFEEYLAAKWGVSRREGYRLIEAAKVAHNVQPSTQPQPTTAAAPGADDSTRRRRAPRDPIANADAPRGTNSLGTPFLSRAAARALSRYTEDTQRRVWARLTTGETPNMEPTADDVREAASKMLIEDAHRILSKKLPPKDQAMIGNDDTEKLEKAARKRATKEKLEKDRAKLVRWAEKFARHVDRMERSGEWPQLKGLGAKAAALEGEVKVRLAGRG